MKCCEVTYLILHVLYGILITIVCLLGEVFFLVIPRRHKSVKGEIVLVTGAGRGLGRRLALNFGRRQAFVICWDKNAEINQNTVWDIRQQGGQAIGFKCDVTDRKAVMETAMLVQQQIGHVTILVNNVGVYPVKPILNWTPEELYKLLDTNLMAHFWTLKAFLPAMLERNSGHVVAVSSAAAIAPVAHEVPYSATKAAVSGLMDGLIQELRLQQNSKIKVTCVHPYYAACRNDLPVKFDLRIGRLSPDYVAKEIVKGVLEEREVISIPRFMLFWICFLRCLPQSARKRWREIFYTRVWPEPVVTVHSKVITETCSVPVPNETEVSVKNSQTKPEVVSSDDIKVHPQDSTIFLEVSTLSEDIKKPIEIYNMVNGRIESPSLSFRTQMFTKIDGDFPSMNATRTDNPAEIQAEQETPKL